MDIMGMDVGEPSDTEAGENPTGAREGGKGFANRAAKTKRRKEANRNMREVRSGFKEKGIR